MTARNDCLTKCALTLFALHAASVAANSIGLNVPICDAYDAKIWEPLPNGKYMWWCDAPVHNSSFTVRTGDGDQKKDKYWYHPGGLTYIHVRSTVRGEKYRGLLLYATDAKGKKVGSWELPHEEKLSFHTPPGSCEGLAVMHSGADPKNYHNAFAWRAPSQGIGKVTFHALLKLGPANTGYFVWPNEKPLVLTQGKPATKEWYKGTKGWSCNRVCTNSGGCDEAKLAAVTSVASFESAISSQHACKLPLLKGCSSNLPSESSTDSFCSYSGCTKKTPLCDRAGGDAARFCPCKGATALNEMGEDEWSEQVRPLTEPKVGIPEEYHH